MFVCVDLMLPRCLHAGIIALMVVLLAERNIPAVLLLRLWL